MPYAKLAFEQSLTTAVDRKSNHCYTIERGFYGHTRGSEQRRQTVSGNLSDLQSEIYHFIVRYIREEGGPPTNREIGKEVDIESTGHIDYHLSVLEKKGYIIRIRNKSRGIKLSGAQRSGLPIAGTIAAGQPLDIYDDAQQEMLDLSTHTRGYVLRVKGQSMIEDHIADGDLVLVDPDTGYRDGDIVVALCKSANGAFGAATL